MKDRIHRLRAYSAVETKFYYCVLYLYKQSGIIGGKGIGIQGLSTKALGRIIFPVPPLAEQKRIIEQINVIFCGAVALSGSLSSKKKTLDRKMVECLLLL